MYIYIKKNKQQYAFFKGVEEILKDLLLSSDIHHILYGFNAARPVTWCIYWYE